MRVGRIPAASQMAGAAVGADHRRGRRLRRLFPEKRRIAELPAGNDKNHLFHDHRPAGSLLMEKTGVNKKDHTR